MQNTNEAVSYLHPDKICDQISDAIVDACIEQDPHSRVAVETMGGHGHIILAGEITTKADLHYEDVAWKAYQKITGKDGTDIKITSHISAQSPNIAQGVDTGGAGDQGIMVGFATSETKEQLPYGLVQCRKILEPFKVDAKAQVTIVEHPSQKPEKKHISDIVLSVQGKTQAELKAYLRETYRYANLYCNNTGSFEIGGFDADSGVTGRKIVQDQYGAHVPTGGGAFSGKDPTKVDRSAAYAARWLAKKALCAEQAYWVKVHIAYVIGKPEPVMVSAAIKYRYDEPCYGYYIQPLIDKEKLDLSVNGIIERFDLRRPIYQDLARNGHFGRPTLPWENLRA